MTTMDTGAPDLATISDAHLISLTGKQRAQLARRLAALSTTGAAPVRERRRWWPAVLALGACLAMIPWTVMLANTLPDRYVATHWSTTWVGFDSLLMASFALMAWATWRRHRMRWTATVVTATLLACDAWFDVTTASTTSDIIGSAITAAAGELPLAGLLIYLAASGRLTGQDRRGTTA
jgi:hypothetical protein